MRKTILCILVLTVMFGVQAQSHAQDLPHYDATVFIAGENDKHARSDVNGYLSAPSHIWASYHHIGLRSETDRLSFKIYFKFKHTTTPGLTDATVENGEPCPNVGASVSHWVQAIRIELAGPDRELYRLEMECATYGPGGRRRHAAEDWCGSINELPVSKIVRINFWLTRK
jgi:hypothetical protein